MSKTVETIEKALPTILAAGVVGLFTMTMQFWVLKSEVANLREDVNELKTTIRVIAERQAHYYGVPHSSELLLARKDK